jgi:8-oxo-dGTP diphosphatase
VGELSGQRGVVVMLTALELEYEAIRAHLTDLTVRRHMAGTLIEVGSAPGVGAA